MVAGASLILPVFNICLSLAGLTGIGGGALISRLLGEGKEDEAKKVSSFSFYLSIAETAVFSIMMFAFMKPVLTLLGASDNTYHYARQYAFCVIVLGGIPTVLSNVMSNLLRSVGRSKEAGFGITMGGIINMALDPLFMFVLLPRGNEVLGVGIATLLFDIDYVVIDKLMASYGDIALAAVGIVLKAERLPLNVGIGICQGMMPLVAYNYSAKNHERMNHIIKFSIKVGIIVSIISIALYEIFAGSIMRIFIPEQQTVLLGTGFLRIRCLATPFMFMSFFTVYVFQGFGEGNKSLFLGVMRWAVFNIPMLVLLNHIIGMYGIVWSQVCADILTVSLSFYVYRRYTHRVLETF